MSNPPLFILLVLMFPAVACIFVVMMIFHFISVALMFAVDNYFRMFDETYRGLS